MKSKHTCPICGDGQFEPLTEVVVLPYKEQEIKVTSRMSLCSACGSEFVNAEDSRVNKRSVLAARKRFDGLLSGEEIYAIRKKYALNQKVAAQLFGGGPVAFSKYENNDVSHAESMIPNECIGAGLAKTRALRADFSPTKPAKAMHASVSSNRRVTFLYDRELGLLALDAIERD